MKNKNHSYSTSNLEYSFLLFFFLFKIECLQTLVCIVSHYEIRLLIKNRKNRKWFFSVFILLHFLIYFLSVPFRIECFFLTRFNTISSTFLFFFLLLEAIIRFINSVNWKRMECVSFVRWAEKKTIYRKEKKHERREKKICYWSVLCKPV